MKMNFGRGLANCGMAEQANKTCQPSLAALVGNSLTASLGVVDVVSCSEATSLAALER